MLDHFSNVLATDISENSLTILSDRYSGYDNLSVAFEDIEHLSFHDCSFDAVFCTCGLSYGDNDLVQNEIYRVLKPGGRFLVVDSLNHNPIYWLNRLIHYFSGRRSLSTLVNMPTQGLINKYTSVFGSSVVYYYGLISWAAPLLSIFLSPEAISSLSDKIDTIVPLRRLAFKFVMLVQKL